MATDRGRRARRTIGVGSRRHRARNHRVDGHRVRPDGSRDGRLVVGALRPDGPMRRRCEWRGCVEEGERGLGVGRCLLAELETWGRARGADRLVAAIAPTTSEFLRARGWSEADGVLVRAL